VNCQPKVVESLSHLGQRENSHRFAVQFVDHAESRPTGLFAIGRSRQKLGRTRRNHRIEVVSGEECSFFARTELVGHEFLDFLGCCDTGLGQQDGK
jgi:hypothetical protein